MNLPRITERRTLFVVYALLIAASLLPFWSVRYHPLPDLAEHLAAVSVWHHHDDPRFDFARYYDLSLGLTPYWGYYLLLHLLSYPFGLLTANRLVLSLYAASLPVGTSLLARRFGRSPWLGLFAFPLIWNFNLAIGFTNFCLGLAALPFALALFDAFCERPTGARAAGSIALALLVYFCHLLPFGLWLGCAGLIGLLHQGLTRRRFLLRLAVWAIPVAAAYLITTRGSGIAIVSAASSAFESKHYPFRQSLQQLYLWVWDSWTGSEDESLAIALFAAWLLLKLTARRPLLRLHQLRAEACFLVALVAYFVLPRSILRPDYWWGVNVRFATAALLFAGLCIPGTIVGWRRLLLVPVALVALGFAADTTVHWRRAERFCAGFDRLAPLPGPGKRVLFIIYTPWEDGSSRQKYAQMYSQIYQAYWGGYMPWNFDIGFPLRYKVRYPAPAWISMVFTWDLYAPYYDYVMTFQVSHEKTMRLFHGHEREVTRVASAGNWVLWKLPGPRLDDPPYPPYPSGWATEQGLILPKK